MIHGYVLPVKLIVKQKEEESARNETYFLEKIFNRVDYSRLPPDKESFGKLVGFLDAEMKEKITALDKLPKAIQDLMTHKWEDRYGRIRTELEPLFRGESKIYLHKEKKCIVRVISSTIFYIIGEKADVYILFEQIKKELFGVSEISKDFGLELKEVLTGHEYTKHILLQNGVLFTLKEPKNEFEKEVTANVSTLTNAFISNIDIKFEDAGETKEFDLLVKLGGTILIIEVMDYTLSTDGPSDLKKNIVTSPKEMAELLTEKTKLIVIVKGLAETQFNDIKRLADNRKVILLNEKNYIEPIEKNLVLLAGGSETAMRDISNHRVMYRSWPVSE